MAPPPSTQRCRRSTHRLIRGHWGRKETKNSNAELKDGSTFDPAGTPPKSSRNDHRSRDALHQTTGCASEETIARVLARTRNKEQA